MFKLNRKNALLAWLLIILVLSLVYGIIGDSTSAGKKISFSDFMQLVDEGNMREAKMRGNIIEGSQNNGTTVYTIAPYFYPKAVDQLIAKGVKLEVLPSESSFGNFINILLSWFPVLLLVGVWIYFMKNMQGGGKAMNFAKSKARMVNDKKKVTFADVAGIDEARDELEELVDFLREPSKFQKLGGKIPRGCLLVGSPGTGKTLLAKAIAGEADVPFFSISGSDFVEMFVGVGASRVRDMFKQAKDKAPCILFIDEIDAVGRHRGIGLGGGNDEREQTLNQLLVEMDGFADNEGVIVIAATNRPDVLDPALLRPGRFDRQVIVSLPDVNGREQILQVHLKNVPIDNSVNIKVIARGTPGFTGADLANMINEAALLAARLGNKTITMRTLEAAKDKVLMGPERRSVIMSEEEKKLTAYHEGGHAIVNLYTTGTDPLHKVTIIPRGRALGVTMSLPEGDKYSVTRQKLMADLAVAMGGRVAEEIIFGYDFVTTGASSDIKAATNIASKMVSQWGMSDKIGPVLISDEKEDMYLGGSQSRAGGHLSDAVSETVDSEVKYLVEYGYEVAKTILSTHIDQLHKLANALLQAETLTAVEIHELLDYNASDKRSYFKDPKSGSMQAKLKSLPDNQNPGIDSKAKNLNAATNSKQDINNLAKKKKATKKPKNNQ